MISYLLNQFIIESCINNIFKKLNKNFNIKAEKRAHYDIMIIRDQIMGDVVYQDTPIDIYITLTSVNVEETMNPELLRVKFHEATLMILGMDDLEFTDDSVEYIDNLEKWYNEEFSLVSSDRIIDCY